MEIPFSDQTRILSLKLRRGVIGLTSGLIVGISVGLFGGYVYGMFTGVMASLIWVMMGGIKNDKSYEYLTTIGTQIPNQGIRRMVRWFIPIGLLNGLILALFTWVNIRLIDSDFSFLSEQFSKANSLIFVLLAAIFGSSIGGIIGGDIVAKHLVIRFFLHIRHYTPLNYARFLDYCADLIFLRKVGGGYIFVHRLLMEHFAALTEADIQRLASAAGAKPSTQP